MLKSLFAVLAVLSFLSLTGCESSDDAPTTYWNTSDSTNTATAATGDTGTADSGGAIPADLSGVVFLHNNVANWSVTATLSSVNVSGGQITLNYNKANVWPGVSAGGAIVNANPWVIVNVDGTWYAGTWEWLRVGQTTKSAASVSGSHIQRAPLNDFQPVSGQSYGFMVSGLARDSTRNVQERSNVVMYTWP